MAGKGVFLRLYDLRDYLQAELIGNWKNIDIKEIKMDSKEINPQDAFLVYGKGNQYIEEALSLGAVTIICEENVNRKDIPILRVKNILATLDSLGSLKRKEFKGKVIAITGSNGKTSTKELLKFLLSSNNKVLANKESENNHIGVPKTLLKLNNNYDYLVLEMGMNHAGEIYHLSSLAKPDIGIITNIGTAHIGNLGSRKAIFKAKMELVEATPSITLFVNQLDRYLKHVSGYQVKEEYPSIASLPAINVSLACKVCEYLGYTKEDIRKRLESFSGVPSRMQPIKINNILLIDDAYNASYESICYGLDVISHYDGKKLVILGDILELGKFSQRVHEKVYQEIQKYDDLNVITMGEETSYLKNKPHFYSIEELKEYLKTISLKDYSIIYLKASHKMGLSQLVNFFQNL